MFVSGCQDDARVQKVTKRVHTLEEVSINVKLLAEMLSHYDQEHSNDSDREIIKVRTHSQYPCSLSAFQCVYRTSLQYIVLETLIHLCLFWFFVNCP